MSVFTEFLMTVLPPALALVGAAVVIIGLVHYKTQSDFKRMDRLIFSMKMGLDYLRQLHQKGQQPGSSKLYKRLNQECRELEGLVDRYSNKLDTDRYQEALQIIHVAAALKPQGNFLTDMAGGVLDLVDDFFPEAEKVTAKLRPKNPAAEDFVYEPPSDDPAFVRIRQIQADAPELVDLCSKIEKNRQQIVEKLKASSLSNKAELLAIHESNMLHFEEVLDGYLRIKADPSQYYRADERLDKARRTLVRVDEILTETLRQINENDLMNFEISLRLLQQES